MPIPQKSAAPVLKEIPEGKLYILDIGLFPYGKKYPSVCQNFEKDFISTLTSGMDLLRKYNKLVMVYPEVVQTQSGTINGYNYFCSEHQIRSCLLYTSPFRSCLISFDFLVSIQFLYP